MKQLVVFVALFCCFPVLLTGQAEFSPEIQPGLQVYKAKTANGTVVVNLPGKIYPGESISGTVIAEPETDPNSRKEKLNKVRLFAQTLMIFGIPVQLDQQTFGLKVPQMPEKSISLLQLSDEKGIVSQSVLSVNEGTRPVFHLKEPAFPEYFRAGEYQNIPGIFDGNTANTTIMLNDLEIPVVAESPGEIVTMLPGNIAGRHELIVREGDNTYKTEVSVVNLDISASAASLRRGEQSSIHLNVTGLAPELPPVTVFVENHTPMNISLTGGNYQQWTIEPSEIGAGMDYSRDINIVAIASGGFSVSARIAEPVFQGREAEAGRGRDQPKAGEGPEPDNGLCGRPWSTEWKDTGKPFPKLDESGKKEVRRNRSKCKKCGEYVDWVYYEIPEYQYQKQERTTYKCTMPKGHANIPGSCHGTGKTETREVKQGETKRYKEIREGSCGCREDVRWVRKK